MPVSLHILTGHGYHKNPAYFTGQGVENYRGSVNMKMDEIANATFDLICYGVLERFPKLRFLSVENEVGWAPFYLQQWDYYYRRFLSKNPLPFLIWAVACPVALGAWQGLGHAHFFRVEQ